MAIALVNNAANRTASSDTHSAAFAPGTASLLIISIGQVGGAGGGTMSNVQFGGVAMTSAGPAVHGIETYYLLNPAAGSANITWSSSIWGRCYYAVASWSGTAASSPVGTPSGATGTSTAPTTGSITCPSGGVVWGAAIHEYSAALTATAGTLIDSFTIGTDDRVIAHSQRADTGALSWSASQSYAWSASGVAVSPGSTATVDQSSCRFGADDGSESGNTWMVGQNTAATIPLGGAARVRFMLQATGDPAATTYQLEFRKVGDATWKKVSP